jgi:hypothetical protein
MGTTTGSASWFPFEPRQGVRIAWNGTAPRGEVSKLDSCFLANLIPARRAAAIGRAAVPSPRERVLS